MAGAAFVLGKTITSSAFTDTIKAKLGRVAQARATR
jgi:hypothetical protein